MAASLLSRRVFLRVRELLDNEEPLASIVAQTHLPLGTIEGIAAGRIQPSRLLIEHDDPQREAMAQARRCPGCGGMVYVWPCLACQMASASASVPLKAPTTSVAGHPPAAPRAAA